jgi:hypothetical protein
MLAIRRVFQRTRTRRLLRRRSERHEALQDVGRRDRVKDGVVTGRVYLKNGNSYEDVYEKSGPAQWRIKSRTTMKP